MNITASIKIAQDAKRNATQVIKNSSKTIYKWKSGSMSGGSSSSSWKSSSGGGYSGGWKYSGGGKYKSSGGCQSCQKVYDNYIKKCMGSSKAAKDSQW
jgi:hypothetical protein